MNHLISWDCKNKLYYKVSWLNKLYPIDFGNSTMLNFTTMILSKYTEKVMKCIDLIWSLYRHDSLRKVRRGYLAYHAYLSI